MIKVYYKPIYVVSAEVTWFNTNLQDKNNQNLFFTVTLHMSDGTDRTVDHAEKVNGQQKGSKIFDYDGYSVYVEWNDNNWVTTCKVVDNTGTGNADSQGAGVLTATVAISGNKMTIKVQEDGTIVAASQSIDKLTGGTNTLKNYTLLTVILLK